MIRNHFTAQALALVVVSLISLVRDASPASYQLITVDTPWRYNQTAADLGTGWVVPTYDDTLPGWKGPSNILFGFETTPTNYLPFTFRTGQGGDFPSPTNVVPYVTNYYFRTHFTMPNLPSELLASTVLLTTNFVDDGSVVYLNGTELFRYNMPAGSIRATTFASVQLGIEGFQPGTQTVFSRSNSPANLVVGDNVLAVELHSANKTSSDEVFGLTLTAVVPDTIVITTQPVGQTNIIGSPTITLAVEVSGSNPSYQWYSNNLAIAGATFRTNNISTAQTNSGTDYYVIVSNGLGSATSSVARVQILSDTFPIKLLSAFSGPPVPPGTSQQNQVLVTLDKTAVTSAATNLANYSIGIFGTTNIIPVANAQSGGNLIRLTTASNLFYGINYVLTVYDLRGTNLIPIQPEPAQIGISIIRTNPPPWVTNTSPLPPRLTIVQQTPNSAEISWTNTGGLTWGLQYSTDLGTNAWTPLAVPSPYTNSITTGSRFFRARVQ